MVQTHSQKVQQEQEAQDDPDINEKSSRGPSRRETP